ncbi:MAG: DsrE family protein [Nanoarchaeota archaeon]|nr:DsrE family protein [Nanoarchaeota archaeon]
MNEGDKVKVFLLAKGVESENGSEKYNVKEQIAKFVSKGGEIYACGTCMKSRQMDDQQRYLPTLVNERLISDSKRI